MTTSPEDRRARAATDAAEWACRLESGDLSDADRIAFVDWLLESRVHVAEILRMERLTETLAALGAGWESVSSVDAEFAHNIIHIDPRRSPPAVPAIIGRFRDVRRTIAVAVAVAIMAVSSALLWQKVAPVSLHTEDGERRELTLADGSIVRLMPGTDLSIRLRSHLRSVKLERGMAIFQVAKDKLRPFIVNAAGAKVLAVGTMFSVRRNGDSVVVTVAEGKVEVTPSTDDSASASSTEKVSLTANERVSVSPHGVTSPIRRMEGGEALSWGGNQIVFENARVSDVVSQFNSRNRNQIRVTDGQLAARKVSGTFDADDPQSFVAFLQAVAGVSSVAMVPGEVAAAPPVSGKLPSTMHR